MHIALFSPYQLLTLSWLRVYSLPKYPWFHWVVSYRPLDSLSLLRVEIDVGSRVRSWAWRWLCDLDSKTLLRHKNNELKKARSISPPSKNAITRAISRRRYMNHHDEEFGSNSTIPSASDRVDAIVCPVTCAILDELPDSQRTQWSLRFWSIRQWAIVPVTLTVVVIFSIIWIVKVANALRFALAKESWIGKIKVIWDPVGGLEVATYHR